MMPSAVQQQQHSRSCDSDVQCHTDAGLPESADSVFHTHLLCCSDAQTNFCLNNTEFIMPGLYIAV